MVYIRTSRLHFTAQAQDVVIIFVSNLVYAGVIFNILIQNNALETSNTTMYMSSTVLMLLSDVLS